MKQVLHRLLCWMPALIAFLLPIHPRLSSLSLAIWSLVALADIFSRGSWRLDASIQKANDRLFCWVSMGSVAYFVFLILGMLWTSDMKEGWFVLEVKFSFLLLPILFWQMQYSGDAGWQNRAKTAFKWGLLCFLCWRILNALWLKDLSLLRYDGFAGPFHPSYMAFYLITGMLLSSIRDWKGIILFLLGGLSIGLLASKGGWTVGLLLIGLEVLRRLQKSKKEAYTLVLSAIFLLGGATWADGGRLQEFQSYFAKSSPSVGKEKSSNLDGNEPISEMKTGSTGGRLQAWKASVELISNHPFGVGTGDVSSALGSIYDRDESNYALGKNMNPHSVWLQAGVRLGWFGMLGMLIWLAGIAWLALKSGNSTLMFWTVALMLNATVESFFELQQGVVAVLFLALLFASGRSERH